jgi:hypothetical protein
VVRQLSREQLDDLVEVGLAHLAARTRTGA